VIDAQAYMNKRITSSVKAAVNIFVLRLGQKKSHHILEVLVQADSKGNAIINHAKENRGATACNAHPRLGDDLHEMQLCVARYCQIHPQHGSLHHVSAAPSQTLSDLILVAVVVSSVALYSSTVIPRETALCRRVWPVGRGASRSKVRSGLSLSTTGV
jgi:hypothetical protein